MADKKKAKYILFKGDAGTKPCAFFSLPEGCRNGANCVFLHQSTSSASAPASEYRSKDRIDAKQAVKDRVRADEISTERPAGSSIKRVIPVATRISVPPVTTSKPAMNPVEKDKPAVDERSRSQRRSEAVNLKKAGGATLSPTPLPTAPNFPVQPFRGRIPTSSPQTNAAQVGSKRSMSSEPRRSTPEKNSRLAPHLEDDDDHAFLVGVVDMATQAFAAKSNANTPFSTKADQVVYSMHDKSGIQRSNSINWGVGTNSDSHESPGYFLDPSEALKRLQTSGTRSAKKLKNAAGVSKNDSDNNVQLPPLPEMSLNDWEDLANRCEKHPKYIREYRSFPQDSTWVTSRALRDW
jgi:hypothetical protein